MAVAESNPTPDAKSSARRIDQLDVLRGIAILGILFINLPGAATYFVAFFGLEPIAGWSRIDRWSWAAMEIFVDGTQKGLLQFLFGAGMLILTARAMSDDGPVVVADIYYRRNLWLLLFGLANVFLLLFPGDILFIYAVAALFLFPFRRLAPRTLLILGLLWTAYATVEGAVPYSERAALQQRVETAEQKRAQGIALSGEDADAARSWAELQQRFRVDPKELAADREKRLGPFTHYASYMQETWLERARTLGVFFHDIPEAFCAMLIGAALFKWGVIQGGRTRRFYLLMMLAAYGIGLSLRIVEVQQHLTYAPGPRVVWFTHEVARLAMTLGHVALVSLVLGSATGSRLLAPFKAAGRTAFSLYVMQTLLTMWLLFPGFGLGLWGRFGWAGMTAITLAIIAGQLLLANVWLRYFAMGPVEWLWRSVVYLKAQPFKRPPARVSALPA